MAENYKRRVRTDKQDGLRAARRIEQLAQNIEDQIIGLPVYESDYSAAKYIRNNILPELKEVARNLVEDMEQRPANNNLESQQ